MHLKSKVCIASETTETCDEFKVCLDNKSILNMDEQRHTASLPIGRRIVRIPGSTLALKLPVCCCCCCCCICVLLLLHAVDAADDASRPLLLLLLLTLFRLLPLGHLLVLPILLAALVASLSLSFASVQSAAAAAEAGVFWLLLLLLIAVARPIAHCEEGNPCTWFGMWL